MAEDAMDTEDIGGIDLTQQPLSKQLYGLC